MIDYEYFMDRMADYELSIFLDNVDYAYVNEWEQTRMLLWGVLNHPLRKFNKKPKDILPLVTDEGYRQFKNAEELNEDETERIKQLFSRQYFEEENIKE